MEPHILLQMPLFRGITEETLLKFVLLHQHTLKSYKSGEFIAMQGDIYRSLYILCNGTVRTQMVSAEGKQLTIETLRAPKLLAPAFIFASENRFPVNIETLETSEVLILNKDAFLGATGLGAYRVQTVQAQGVSVTHVGQTMDSRDMEQKAIKMIQHKDFLLKRIQEKPVFQEMIENGTFEQVALPVEKILKFKNPGACFVVTYAYKWNGSEYTDTVRFYHSMQDYKELLAYFKERYEAEK